MIELGVSFGLEGVLVTNNSLYTLGVLYYTLYAPNFHDKEFSYF
jgi:hypothetical protein